MRFKPYEHGECKGSWMYPEPEGEYGLRPCWCGPVEHTHRIYGGTVVCQYCGRRVGISKRGFMHRHENMVGEPRGRAWP